jgi:hypothetical protein
VRQANMLSFNDVFFILGLLLLGLLPLVLLFRKGSGAGPGAAH